MTITTSISQLLRDPKKRFTQVEMKFFKMWWDEQTEKTRNVVRGLVSNGQLELVNGGWSMHDEACPAFDDFIENMMFGHNFIFDNFGVKPRIGWQIDPFGHSSANARLFAEMGFDALFFSRLDYKDKEKRMNNLEMEWVWRPNSNTLGNKVQIFTHATQHHYSAPPGFDFEIHGDNWINDKTDK